VALTVNKKVLLLQIDRITQLGVGGSCVHCRNTCASVLPVLLNCIFVIFLYVLLLRALVDLVATCKWHDEIMARFMTTFGSKIPIVRYFNPLQNWQPLW